MVKLEIFCVDRGAQWTKWNQNDSREINIGPLLNHERTSKNKNDPFATQSAESVRCVFFSLGPSGTLSRTLSTGKEPLEGDSRTGKGDYQTTHFKDDFRDVQLLPSLISAF